MSNYLFECEGLTKKFGSKTALEDVTFRLSGGRIVGLLGPNGSGKTTLIKLANGLLTPSSGSILIGGNAPGIQSKRMVSYLPDSLSLPEGMKVSEVIRYYEDFFEDFSMEKYHQMLERMELTEDMKAKKLSSGMMAKLKIAVTMARKAKVYLLDEPLNGIDLLARDQIMTSILEGMDKDVTLVVSSHLVDELERVADAALFMKDGHLVEQCMIEDLRMNQNKSVVDLYREIYGHGGEGQC